MVDVVVFHETGNRKTRKVRISFGKDDDPVKILTETVRDIEQKYFNGTVTTSFFLQDGPEFYLIVAPFEKYARAQLANIINN